MKRYDRLSSFVVVLGMFITNEACDRDSAQVTNDAANTTTNMPMMNTNQDAGSTYGGHNGMPGMGGSQGAGGMGTGADGTC